MKPRAYLLVLLFCTLFIKLPLSLAFVSEPISGIIELNQGQLELRSHNNKISKLLALTTEAKDSLEKLKAKDFLVGSGQIHGDKILLEKVYFVGLYQLLGVWSNPAVWLQVRNYSELNLLSQDDRRKNFSPGLYRYTISPDSLDGWQIYFQGPKEVYIGTLKLNNREAQIQFYNSETGSVITELGFRKVYSY